MRLIAKETRELLFAEIFVNLYSVCDQLVVNTAACDKENKQSLQSNKLQADRKICTIGKPAAQCVVEKIKKYIKRNWGPIKCLRNYHQKQNNCVKTY